MYHPPHTRKKPTLNNTKLEPHPATTPTQKTQPIQATQTSKMTDTPTQQNSPTHTTLTTCLYTHIDTKQHVQHLTFELLAHPQHANTTKLKSISILEGDTRDNHTTPTTNPHPRQNTKNHKPTPPHKLPKQLYHKKRPSDYIKS